MNNSHNEHPSLLETIIGWIVAIGVFIEKIASGVIEHNGGKLELLYSVISLILFGVIGTVVSFSCGIILRWLHKKTKI